MILAKLLKGLIRSLTPVNDEDAERLVTDMQKDIRSMEAKYNVTEWGINDDTKPSGVRTPHLFKEPREFLLWSNHKWWGQISQIILYIPLKKFGYDWLFGDKKKKEVDDEGLEEY